MIAGENSGQLDSIQMDFVARRFDTFSEVFTIEYYDDDQILQEVDLTGAEVQMQVKKRKGDGPVLLNMDVAISGNEITISKHHSLMDTPKGKYWFDLEVKDSDGDHITWVHGRFTIVEHVTQFISTFYSYVSAKFEALLEMSGISKTIFATTIHSILNFMAVIPYRFKAMISSILGFETLERIMKEYPGFFSIILKIINVPKMIITGVFEMAVGFIGKIPFYRDAPFSVSVFFYDTGEESSPYEVE